MKIKLLLLTWFLLQTETKQNNFLDMVDEISTSILVPLIWQSTQISTESTVEYSREESSTRETPSNVNLIKKSDEISISSEYLATSTVGSEMTSEEMMFPTGSSSTSIETSTIPTGFSSSFETSTSDVVVSLSQADKSTSDTSDVFSSEQSITSMPDDEFSAKEAKVLIQAMTLYNHNLRVELVRQTHIIKNLTVNVNELRDEVSKLKATHDSEIKFLKAQNENCRLDFNRLMRKLRVANNLIQMESYSIVMREKLGEFVELEESKKNANSTSITFTVFKIETEKFLGQILSNKQLQILPPRLGEIVGNVSELSASSVGLLAINRNAFENLSELKVLNLSRNEISDVENETFIELVELVRLDLSYNSIGLIEILSFSGLNDLEELNLSKNQIMSLATGHFDSLMNLKILNLSFNRIRALKNEIFTSINVIEEFYIQSNKLEHVNPVIVSNFEKAKIIDFRENLCIDLRFPENSTMVQMVLEVVGRCSVLK